VKKQSINMHKFSLKKQFLLPKYWPTWIGLGFLYLIVKLPYQWQLNVGKFIGNISYLLGKRRRHIAKTNITLCFPDKSSHEQEVLLKRHFQALGIGLIETGMAFFMSDKHIKNRTQVKGIEHLNNAYNKGHGIILLASHFTTLELAIRIVTQSTAIPIHGVYREQKNLLFSELLFYFRHRFNSIPISRHDPHGVMSSLKQGAPVFYLPDQDYGSRFRHIFVPFFGVPAATIVSTARIARISQAAVIPLVFHRKKDNSGYHIEFRPALDNFPTNDIKADTQRINKTIESVIECAPEQYFWVHRRFKTRPSGEKKLY